MNKDLLTKLQKKNEKDYKELIKDIVVLEPTKIVNKAYELAHYNEITDFLDSVAYDEDWCNLDEEEINNIIEYKDNFIKRVWNTWLNYRHPERYNFFCYEDLIDIIKEVIYNLNK